MQSFINKIQKYGPLSSEESRALAEVRSRVIRVAPNTVVVDEGSASDSYHILLDGFVACSKALAGDKRQIIAFCVPGDACDLNALTGGRAHYSVTALMPSTLAVLRNEDILALIKQHPRIAEAFWGDLIRRSVVFSEWIVNIGSRSGAERVAHLICEIFVRLDEIGLARPRGFEWPVTQVQLGSATGLSTVHVNRIFRELKVKNLLSLFGNSVMIDDLQALKDFCGFEDRHPDVNSETAQAS